MLVTFLSKAKGAPPAVLKAWGISQPQEEASSPAQPMDAQPRQASHESELPKTATSSGNRDVPSMKSHDRESSRGARRSRTQLALTAASESTGLSRREAETGWGAVSRLPRSQ